MMSGGEGIVMIVTSIGFFSTVTIAIRSYHERKLKEAELRLKGHAEGSLRQEVDALKQEMRNLRDTTMQYDLSFDTALQRMENRMESLEQSTQNARTTDTEPLHVRR